MKTWLSLSASAVLLLTPSLAKTAFAVTDGLGNEVEQVLTMPLPQGAAPGSVRHSFARLPLSFVRNDGQANPATKFEVRGCGYLLSLEQTEAVMVLTSPANEDALKQALKMRPSYEVVEPWIEGTVSSWFGSDLTEKAAEDHCSLKPGGESTLTFHFLRMALVGANPNTLVTGEDELPGKFHYFIGNDPGLWRTNVPSFAKVRCREVYPGIDLVYYGNEGQLEYDFVVGPRADPSQIALAIGGADRVAVTERGDLRLEVAGRELFWRKPVLYQEKDGVQIPVAGEFVLLATAPSNDGVSARQVAFRVAPYDRTLALVIDPVLAYSTYLGGGISDAAYGVAVDALGCAYVAGQTFSRSSYNGNPAPGNPFPTTTNAVKQTFSVISGAFVTKFSAEGNQVLYSTVLCGNSPSSQSTVANAIKVDGQGQAVITGNTDASDFPRRNALQPRYGGGYSDAFVAKLTPDGSDLVFSTFLGGSKEESQGITQGLGLDAAFNIYVAGQTRSANFPITNAVQTALGGDWDWFVTKMDADGTRLLYSTFLGGSDVQGGPALTVDPTGHAYIAGNRYLVGNTGPEVPLVDVAKLGLTGSVLDYSVTLTNLYINGMAVDLEGSLHLTGGTTSEALPVTPTAFQSSIAGGADAFIAKLNPMGSALDLLTYLGGKADDSASAIALDQDGNAVVVGMTRSPDFPTREPIQGENRSPDPDGGDAFVFKLSADGSILFWSTYLGGGTPYWIFNGVDEALAVALDTRGAVYVAGKTTTSDFPVEHPFQAMLDTSHGTEDAFPDAFLVKLAEPLPHSVEITRTGSTITISWPVSAIGFTLESTGSLAPSPNWQPEPTAPEIVGDQHAVTVEIDGGAKFFRLRKP